MSQTKNNSENVIVVGGGAAGIIAARKAADSGARVLLLEKNDRLGLKILISGGGKCNLTHTGSMEEVRAAFRPNEARFLKASFYRYTNKNFLEILHERGMATYTRPDGRIFPVEPSDAKDVVELLTQYVEESGVQIRYRAPVTGLDIRDGAIHGVRCAGANGIESKLATTRVIVCTGGSSYPATGTTGDGWKWLASAGHSIVPLRAALAPLYLEQAHPERSGIAVRDIVVRARISEQGKEYARWTGDLLFTHKGVSGPTALAVSRDVAEHLHDAPGSATIEVDIAPEQSWEDLHAALRQAIQENPRKTIGGLVAQYVPANLVDPVIETTGLDRAARGANLTAKALNRLVSVLKGWPLGRVRNVPLERGEVVAGGVALDEVNPQTMESRLVQGLYLCGEVLDIAGPVGGYNLQAAWSTGYVAGESAAKR